MTDLALFAAAIGGGLASGWLGARSMLARARRRGAPVDLPDERRLHTMPTPRGGGVGILVAAVAALAVATLASDGVSRRLVIAIVFWALPMGALGLADDHRSMPRAPKLLVQLACATAAVALGLRVDTIAVPPIGALDGDALGAVFSVLWLVWLTNLFNFMDGMDALAAACGAVFCAGFVALGLAVGAVDAALVAAAIGAALLGFVRYNWPPAMIFMGDGGSLFTGAALGGLGLAIAGDRGGGAPVSIAALLVGSFLWDATYTIVRRALRREPLRPHRTHLYQRLVLAGRPQHEVIGLYVALSVLGVTTGLVSLHGGAAAQAGALAIAAVAAATLVMLTAYAERQRTCRPTTNASP